MKFCEEPINGIKFVYTTSEAIASIISTLVNRFTLTKTISGTQSYHQFEISTDSAIKMKCISYDDDFGLEFDLLGKKTRFSNASAILTCSMLVGRLLRILLCITRCLYTQN